MLSNCYFRLDLTAGYNYAELRFQVLVGEEKMIGRLFFATGLTFLVISICGLLIIILLLQLPKHSSSVVPLKQPTCIDCLQGGGSGVPAYIIISDATPDGLVVYDEWPKQMDVNASDTISW